MKQKRQKTSSRKIVESSSFRDPAGFVFRNSKGKLLRQINLEGLPDFSIAQETGLYEELINKKLLISHKITKKNADTLIIEPYEISSISYPFEWAFSMLKDAALTTLEIQEIALSKGLTLKDASAYNIQFLHGKPIFIDTLSFKKYVTDTPWIAYGQFCRHFLAPLVLMANIDARLSKLQAEYIDGIPLDLTARLLPKRAFIKPSIFMHLLLQARAQTKKAKVHKKNESKLSKHNQLAMIDNLKRSIRAMKLKDSQTEWQDYYNNTNYSSTAADSKSKQIKKFAKKIPNIKLVIDFGGNNGQYGRLFSNDNIETICTDIDSYAVESNYLNVKKNNEKSMLPLVVDLTSPTGVLGWANEERLALDKRFRTDLSLALALIHHLAISNNLPFPMIAEYFSRFSRYLIIEFVPKSDSQVKKLLSTREDIFTNYDEKNFEQDFARYYSLMDKVKIEGTKRTLYLFRKIENAQK